MNRPMSLVEQMMEAISIVRQERLGGALPAEPETSSSCSPMTASQPPAAESTLPAVRQWSHPFGDRADPLLQLTQLAKAASGYYPLGRNGIWHPGVHFDSGTAGTQDQSHIRCLADGEVVAYRIDSRTPTTTYRVNRQPVQRSFARGFVLVRHRLQAPRIDGNPVEPPSLTFYSLYMHLQDWAAYQAGPGLQRPSFWPAGNTRKVKDSEKDSAPYLEGLVWLRTRIGPEGGAALSGLARGTTVTVSGSGRYRRLENFPGPRPLLLDDGTLNGHVSFNYLAPLDGDRYRVTAHQLIVRSTASRSGQELMRLPQGTVVTISGEGEYRKLEWVDQYVHFDSLLSEPEPLRPDGIVVLDQPVPIKAGELIGHLGDYQNGFAEQPSPQLHLEVFSGENVETFIRRCRAWAQRLPASGKTWLKLPRGTPVVPHQEHFSPITPPTAITGTPSSDADLLLPKHWLDGLGPDRKIKLSATEGHEACTWYRLDDLLHDAGRQLLKGWVKVEDDSS
ncbi:SH3 domain-containing protein, partial [Metapseudomonas furukawaii]